MGCHDKGEQGDCENSGPRELESHSQGGIWHVAHQWENNWFKLVDANNTMVEVIGDLAEMTRPSLAVPISHERLDKFICANSTTFFFYKRGPIYGT